MRIKKRSVRAIVLADGSNLGPIPVLGKPLENSPKCLREIGGKTLLSRLLDILNSRGIRDITVVVLGSEADKVEREGGSRARYIKNPFRQVLGSVASLWFARRCLQDDDILVLEAGLFFEESVLDKLLDESAHSCTMLCDSSRRVDTSHQFKLDDGLLCGYSECSKAGQTTSEYLGMAMISASFVSNFHARLNYLVETDQWASQRWEDVLCLGFASENIAVEARDIVGLFWSGLNCSKDYNDVVAWADVHR